MSTGPQATQTVALATDERGVCNRSSTDATTATSRFEDYMEDVVQLGSDELRLRQRVGRIHVIAPMDTYTPGDMRAPGAATGMTLFEIAHGRNGLCGGHGSAGFRTLNYSDKNAMDDKPFTSKALREAYAEGAERFGWERRSPAPRINARWDAN